MAKLAGSDGAVHAFEPSELCEQIAYHAELNGRDHVLAPVSARKRFVVGDAVQSHPPSATVDDVVARDVSLERVDGHSARERQFQNIVASFPCRAFGTRYLRITWD
jgi:hypothetical protein